MKNVLRFLPLLVLFVLLAGLRDMPDIPRSDAARYIWFARNLSEGFYSPKHHINLWNGPGYPMILLPVLLLKLPWSVAAFFNAFFMFGALLYLYCALRHYVSVRSSSLAVYVLGLWPPVLKLIPRLMTETVSIFLVCGFVFHICRLHRSERDPRRHLLLASFFAAYLALTKVIFGYVILAALLFSLIVFLVRRHRMFKKWLLVYCVALAFCLPYLLYTYSLTGKIFYWGTSGGMSLYWMSSPHKNDLGDWHILADLSKNPELFKDHGAFFSQIGDLSPMAKDDALKKQAIDNIVNNPAKYLRNWVANVGRLLINYPYSYSSQKLSNYSHMIAGMLLAFVSVLCIYPTYVGRREIPDEIWATLLFGAIFFGGSSLLSGSSRLFLPALPVCILWISFVLTRIVRIEILR